VSHGTIVHRLIRPAVRPLARTRITPDHLTALRFATGVAAAAAFAAGSRGWLDIGAAMFLLSALLDRADGELARQTRRFSQYGARHDVLADWAATALGFVGLGIGARGSWLGVAAPLLGLLAAISVTALFCGMDTPEMRRLSCMGNADGHVVIDPDDSVLLVPVAVWLAGPPVVLLPAGILAPLLTLWMLAGLRRRLRAAPSRPDRSRHRRRTGHRDARRSATRTEDA
jgi:archaetidylinositol phosphate synthase